LHAAAVSACSISLFAALLRASSLKGGGAGAKEAVTKVGAVAVLHGLHALSVSQQCLK
jgi:hypothetical protein